MSQKTNPLSLRLQKSNQNFISPWFSDYFFNANFHYQSSIEKYISFFLKESQYAKAFFSAKNDYRKSNIFLIIQDIRAQRKEKILFFNLKQNQSIPKYTISYKNSTFEEASFFSLQKAKNNEDKQIALLQHEEMLYNSFVDHLPEIFLKKKIKKDFREKPLIKADFLKNFLVVQQQIQIENREKRKKVKKLSIDNSNRKAEALKKLCLLLNLEKSVNSYNKNLIRGAVRNKKILQIRDDESLKCIPTYFLTRDRNKGTTFNEKDKVSANNRNIGGGLPLEHVQQAFLFSLFRKKIRNDFLKYKQNYNLVFFSYTHNYFDFFAERYNFYKNKNYLKHWWEMCWQDNIRTNHCLSFSEKIVDGSFFVPSSQTLVSSFSLNKDNNKERFLNSNSLDLIVGKRYISPNFLSLSKKQKTGINTKRKSKNSTSFFPITTYLEPIRFIDDLQNVKALLDNVVALIEKRFSFGQIKSKLFEDLSKNLQIKGVRISCSGRLGGRSKKAQKAKLQSDQWGATALNAFSSKVLFAKKSAYTSYGKVGVKIWLSFKKDIF